MMGIDNFDAIINPPHGSILAVGKTQEVVCFDENEKVIKKTIIQLTLSVDHRMIDGAIGAKFLNEIASFFYLKKESIDKLNKHWATGIGSFDKSHLLSHRSKRFQITDDDIEEIKINCINFESLRKKYSIYKIEKLMIDVEGAEFKILNSINFGDIEIKEIFFEKKHFDGYMRQGKKFEEIKEKLKYHNYILQDVDEENIKAYLKE